MYPSYAGTKVVKPYVVATTHSWRQRSPPPENEVSRTGNLDLHGCGREHRHGSAEGSTRLAPSLRRGNPSGGSNAFHRCGAFRVVIVLLHDASCSEPSGPLCTRRWVGSREPEKPLPIP